MLSEYSNCSAVLFDWQLQRSPASHDMTTVVTWNFLELEGFLLNIKTFNIAATADIRKRAHRRRRVGVACDDGATIRLQQHKRR